MMQQRPVKQQLPLVRRDQDVERARRWRRPDQDGVGVRQHEPPRGPNRARATAAATGRRRPPRLPANGILRTPRATAVLECFRELPGRSRRRALRLGGITPGLTRTGDHRIKYFIESPMTFRRGDCQTSWRTSICIYHLQIYCVEVPEVLSSEADDPARWVGQGRLVTSETRPGSGTDHTPGRRSAGEARLDRGPLQPVSDEHEARAAVAVRHAGARPEGGRCGAPRAPRPALARPPARAGP